MVKLLLEYNADANVYNKEGQTPLNLGTEMLDFIAESDQNLRNEFEEIIKLLQLPTLELHRTKTESVSAKMQMFSVYEIKIML